MHELAQLPCRPIKADTPRLTEHEARQVLTKLPGWNIHEKDGQLRLEKIYKFETFTQAMAFTNQVAREADQQDHHPAILTEWVRVTVTWWTHRIGGLHQNDFIMAARTEMLYGSATRG